MGRRRDDRRRGCLDGRRRDLGRGLLGDEALGRWAWRSWSFGWDADPGEHELCSRAWDSEGRSQPLEPPWNVGGYANNAVQRVAVTVVR